MISVSTDSQADARYITVDSDAAPVEQVEAIAGHLILDLGPDDAVVGIEVIGALDFVVAREILSDRGVAPFVIQLLQQVMRYPASPTAEGPTTTSPPVAVLTPA